MHTERRLWVVCLEWSHTFPGWLLRKKYMQRSLFHYSLIISSSKGKVLRVSYQEIFIVIRKLINHKCVKFSKLYGLSIFVGNDLSTDMTSLAKYKPKTQPVGVWTSCPHETFKVAFLIACLTSITKSLTKTKWPIYYWLHQGFYCLIGWWLVGIIFEKSFYFFPWKTGPPCFSDPGKKVGPSCSRTPSAHNIMINGSV